VGIAANVVLSREGTATNVQSSVRISALDYTKGALVLIMVLYHWLNYFYGLHDNRYLRFLTPSFIFITGFLISNVYLAKYNICGPKLRQRLMYRGLKILGTFTVLNAIIAVLSGGFGNAKLFLLQLATTNALAVFVTGNVLIAGVGRGVAFYILVPIAYLLVLSSALFMLSRFYKYVFHVVCASFLLGVLALRLKGLESSNLELLAIGLLGVIAGYVPIAKINTVVRHPLLLAVAYLGYLAAISFWNVIYPLQIVGVFLSLMILYFLGGQGDETGGVRSRIILLGKYSLFGYIAQIAILQLLRRAFRHTDLGPGALAVSFVLAVALTVFSVEVVDRARRRSTAVDKVYRWAFA
jgi:hypothetical protein